MNVRTVDNENKDDNAADRSWRICKRNCLLLSVTFPRTKSPMILNLRIPNFFFIISRTGQWYEGYLYTSTLDCFKRSVSIEGWRALYRGFFPAYLRLGPHFVIGWPLLEFFRREVFGLDYF